MPCFADRQRFSRPFAPAAALAAAFNVQNALARQPNLRTVVVMASRSIGEFELAVLLCIGLLRDDAYGVAVRASVSKRLGRDCSIGAVYTTLQRLENKGLVKSRTADPTPVRGGRAKRYFALTAAGERSIRQAQATARRLWSVPGLRVSRT